MKYVIGATCVAMMMAGGALAQEKTQVQPGTGPTEAVGEAVPTMKDRCPDQAQVDTKAPGTQATEATGAAVPTMKPDGAVDCPDSKATTTTN